jgi:ABC-type proline/glycine betaine transport system ATPase subunit
MVVMVGHDSMTEKKISVLTENQIQIGKPITIHCTKLPQNGFVEEILGQERLLCEKRKREI